ncbi:MAG: hypothetical protein KKB70_08515 [Proteobacteria bacterium]|nr:hypothetical protein [Pseudomonadota bacterium]
MSQKKGLLSLLFKDKTPAPAPAPQVETPAEIPEEPPVLLWGLPKLLLSGLVLFYGMILVSLFFLTNLAAFWSFLLSLVPTFFLWIYLRLVFLRNPLRWLPKGYVEVDVDVDDQDLNH